LGLGLISSAQMIAHQNQVVGTHFITTKMYGQTFL